MVSISGGYATLVNLEDPFASAEGRVAPNIPPSIKPGKASVPSLTSSRINKPKILPKALEGTPANPKRDQSAPICFSCAFFFAKSTSCLSVNLSSSLYDLSARCLIVFSPVFGSKISV